MGLGVGGAPKGRSATRAYLGLVVEMASMNARASLLAQTPPIGMRAVPTRPNTPNDETGRLPRRAVALGASSSRAMTGGRQRRECKNAK